MKKHLIAILLIGQAALIWAQNENNSGTSDPNPLATGTAKTNYTKESIYSEKSITYFGLDLSLMNLLSYTKLGKDETYLQSLDELVKINNSTMSESRVKSWFNKKEVKIDHSFTSSEYKNYMSKKWIVNQTQNIDQARIQQHLLNYKTSGTGVGLVIIPELFNENTRNGNMFFVWFDIETKAIIFLKRSYGVQSNGITIEGTWDYSVVDATKYYVDNYFKKKK